MEHWKILEGFNDFTFLFFNPVYMGHGYYTVFVYRRSNDGTGRTMKMTEYNENQQSWENHGDKGMCLCVCV